MALKKKWREAKQKGISKPAIAIAGHLFRLKEKDMGQVVYVSKPRIERKQGPLRVAYLPGEPNPVKFSVHGAIAEHYKVKPEQIQEPHASTIDYVIAATAG